MHNIEHSYMTFFNSKTTGEAPTIALLKGGAITFYILYKAKGLSRKEKKATFLYRGVLVKNQVLHQSLDESIDIPLCPKC